MEVARVEPDGDGVAYVRSPLPEHASVGVAAASEPGGRVTGSTTGLAGGTAVARLTGPGVRVVVGVDGEGRFEFVGVPPERAWTIDVKRPDREWEGATPARTGEHACVDLRP